MKHTFQITRQQVIFLSLFALVFFQCILPTTGVNIYTIKDGKALILLSREHGGWTDFTGAKDADKDKPNPSLPKNKQAQDLWKNVAAREAHEESMGVFLDPTSIDPNPENNVARGKAFFKSKFNKNYYISVRPNPSGNKNWRHSSWFVKVKYIHEKHLNKVLKTLKKRSAKHDYTEKTKYKWFLMNNLLLENISKIGIHLRTHFKLMIKTSEAQAMLSKIIEEAESEI